MLFDSFPLLQYGFISKHGLLCRGQSGLGIFGPVPPGDVQKHFARELHLGVPRTMMGKSIFSFNRLIRSVVWTGIPRVLVDLDIRKCFTQLRFLNAPSHLQDPELLQYLQNDKAIIAKLAKFKMAIDTLRSFLRAEKLFLLRIG